MTTFAAAFRELVMPDLRRSARLQALSLARAHCEWSDATSAVMRQAMSRGAGGLPDHLLQELIGWVDMTVLKTVTAIEADEAVAAEIIDEACVVALRIMEKACQATT